MSSLRLMTSVSKRAAFIWLTEQRNQTGQLVVPVLRRSNSKYRQMVCTKERGFFLLYIFCQIAYVLVMFIYSIISTLLLLCFIVVGTRKTNQIKKTCYLSMSIIWRVLSNRLIICQHPLNAPTEMSRRRCRSKNEIRTEFQLTQLFFKHFICSYDAYKVLVWDYPESPKREMCLQILKQ